MDPSLEQRLRDEVVYLHSLWHEGPPPNPPLPDHSSSRPIPISNPTPFKKQNSAPAKMKNKKTGQKHETSEEPKQPEKEWPCKEEPITQPSPAWPPMEQKEPDSGQKSRSASDEEQAKMVAQVMQQRAVEQCRSIFAKVGDSDGEEEEDEAEEEDDDDGDGDEVEEDRVEGDNGGLEESKEYKFMLDVFVKDRELREYYERNHESGDFWCFVCGARGGKMSGRKFKNCYGVLQHSINISKTKKRRAHRAFGLVICRVMGWDVERLPLIVAKGKPLSHSLMGPSLSQIKENAGVNKEDAENVAHGRDKNGQFGRKTSNNAMRNVNELIGETVSEEDNATKSIENHCEEISVAGINGEGKADGPVREKTAAKKDDSTGVKYLNRGNIDAGADEEELLQCSESVPLPTSSVDWPCGNLVDSSDTAASGWRSFKSLSSHSVLTVVKGESETWHQKVFQACHAFFRCRSGSESDGDEEADDEDDEEENDGDDEDEGDLLDGDVDRECEVIKFFMKLFMENAELKSYYENKYGDGDFCCLVCAGVGNKPWKRFKGCNGLLQHCTTIWKIKKLAHKAYARAICKVLNWDINCFPPIKNTSEALGHCLVQSGDMQGGGTEKIFVSINCPDANDSVSIPASSIKWPCESPIDHAGMAASEWPSFKSPSTSANHSDSAEEKGDSESWHQKVLEACHAFFNCTSGSDSDGEEEADDEAEDEGDDDEEVLHGDEDGECEIVQFFTMLFTENAELRSYYHSKYRDGDFGCLVCAGVGKKPWKRFKGCTGLLQHSTTIVKTKKRAHRAYGRAVCKLLGWDITKSPSIGNSLETLNHSSVQPTDTLGNGTDTPPKDDATVCQDIGAQML